MITPLKKLLVVALVAACGILHADDDSTVLWWWFDETTEIEEIGGGSTTIDQLTGRGDAEGKTVNGIRVAAYNGDSLLGYLTIADPDGVPGEYFPMPATDFDSGNADSWSAGPTYANITPYATTPGVTFMIELGNWDDTLPEGEKWQILAHSDAETPGALDNFINNSLDMQTELEWTGGHYSVPEPSSGLLLLIGGALLSLRRRRS